MREVMTAWMTASTSGPPRFCSISAIAETGPIWSKPTPAIAESVSGTTIVPMPIPPTVIGTTRSGKYGMPACRVEPYSMAPSTRMPPTITSTRGEKNRTSCEEAPNPIPIPMTNGMKPTPARSAE